ncbi:MAG: C1 family peptidase [Acidobacteriota bacterium]|nr:C1 family peptidase [Acidobacteriota bacterium]
MPDPLDFRDQMFAPTLVEVPRRITLDSYREIGVPILNQGSEGACTGFGLATVAHYLLLRRTQDADRGRVSSRMLYEMAKRYDEWPGENYSGSSARGAMKGWHKHGVCSEDFWPYDPARPDRRFTTKRAGEAANRPLGAYYRVNHKDLIAMHSAIAEVGILYATGMVHEGWNKLDAEGIIAFPSDRLGGHAFAIVAYDDRGFWIQNSWGPKWGNGGFALITYDDWLANSTDVWVARLGAPVKLRFAAAVATAISSAAKSSETYAFCDLRPHIVSLGNEGRFRTNGTFGTDEQDVEDILARDYPKITKEWKKKRVLLYAHGGLVGEDSAIQRVAEYRAALLKNEVYPLSFIWQTDFWSTLKNILNDAASRRRPEGFIDSAKDFLLDRLDDALEPLARALTGKLQWDEMKENALRATTTKEGGLGITARLLSRLVAKDGAEIHLAAHSAGAILFAPLVQLLTGTGTIGDGPLKGTKGLGLKIASCTLWAPALTVDLFKQTYMPAIRSGGIKKFTLFTLTDAAEQDDHCANVYHKSLLYLVSNALENRVRIPVFRDGVPILGMAKFINKDSELLKLFKLAKAEWILSPNAEQPGSNRHATSSSHGGFDDDGPTVRSTLDRIIGAGQKPAGANVPMRFANTASSMRDTRAHLARAGASQE